MPAIPGYNQGITFRASGTNRNIRQALEMYLAEAAKQTRNIAPSFKGATEKETAANIFSYVYNKVRYVEDGDKYQAIKLPGRLLRSRSGDCKSMALFIAGVLKNLGIPAYFKYVSFNPRNRTPSHVYVVTGSGIIIDPVAKRFNYEVPYKYSSLKKI